MIMKRGKKAQLTLFIIFAVIILGVGGVAYYVTSDKSVVDNEYFSQPGIKESVDSIQDSIFECIKVNANDALELVGIQGGYYDKPKSYFDLGWAFIPYYYKEGQISRPEKSTIELEVGKALDDNINDCFDQIEVKDFVISYKKPKTSVNIQKGNVVFTMDLPITIKKDNKRIIINPKDNSVSVNSEINEMFEIATYITDSHKENPELVCINCVADMAKERNLFVDMMDFDDATTTLVVISGNNTEISPSVFEFLNKYPAKEE